MENPPANILRFIFMDGLGNDFIILDARGNHNFLLTHQQVEQLASRNNQHTGGCDQLIVMEDAPYGSRQEGCFMRIYNQDGSEVDACGNATRCVGWLLLKETQHTTTNIHTTAGMLHATRTTDAQIVTVNMGKPRILWQEIPLGWECNTINLGVNIEHLQGGTAVSMGNPHVVFFVQDDIETIKLNILAPQIQNWTNDTKKLFPEGVNVGIANIISDTELNLRVYERGVGETLACGTGACAAAVAAMRLGYVARSVVVHLRGGDLSILWQENDTVLMSGAVHFRHEETATLQEMLV